MSANIVSPDSAYASSSTPRLPVGAVSSAFAACGPRVVCRGGADETLFIKLCPLAPAIIAASAINLHPLALMLRVVVR